MNSVDLPPIHPGSWRGVYVQPAEIAGAAMWAVTVRKHGGAATRRWFAERPAAYAFAASEADRLELPLFNHADEGAEP